MRPTMPRALAVTLAVLVPGLVSAAPPASPAPAAPAPAPARAPTPEPPTARIEVAPARVMLRGHWAEQVLQVSTVRPDGRTVDARGTLRFESANPGVATVDATGLVRPVGDGETLLTVVVPAASGPEARATVPVVVQAADDLRVDFDSHVMPLIARLGCNTAACHGTPRGRGGFASPCSARNPTTTTPR